MKKKKIFINIGFPKTATTWLQNEFFSTHQDIEFLGKSSRKHVQQLTRLQMNLQNEPDITFSPKKSRDTVRNIIRKHPTEKKIYGVSYEGLSFGNGGLMPSSLYVAERLKESFKDFDTRIIIGIRNQTSMLESYYNQYIKRGGRLPSTKLLFSPNKRSVALRSKLFYHTFITHYQHVFGKENVFVYVFEEFKSEPAKVLKQLCKFLGISEPPTPDKKKQKQGLSKITISIHRFLNTFLTSKLNESPLSPLSWLTSLSAMLLLWFRQILEKFNISSQLQKKTHRKQ
ncbi:sulfotransferase domain-containing protein [Candidatus Woesearchaeota archaeon]|nr:sulfotransferase domain-containing protein [Candidatus Woesearchaeota archaeon]